MIRACIRLLGRELEPSFSADLEDLIHPPDDVLHRRQVAEFDLGRDPSLVADVHERLMNGRPVDLAFAELVIEPFGLGVFFDVDLEDALA